MGFYENQVPYRQTGESNLQHMGFKKNFTFNPNATEFRPTTRFIPSVVRSQSTPLPPPPVQTAETAPQLIPIVPISSNVYVPSSSLQPILCIPIQPYSPAALSPMAQNSEYPPPAPHQWGSDKDYAINCQPRTVILPPTQKATGDTIFIPFIVNKSSHPGVFTQGPSMPSVGMDEGNSSEMYQPAIQYVTMQNGTYGTSAPTPPAPNTTNSVGNVMQSNWQQSYDQSNGKYIFQRPGYPPIIGVPMASEPHSNIPPNVPFIQCQENWNPTPNTHHQLETPQTLWVPLAAQTDNPWIHYGNGGY